MYGKTPRNVVQGPRVVVTLRVTQGYRAPYRKNRTNNQLPYYTTWTIALPSRTVCCWYASYLQRNICSARMTKTLRKALHHAKQAVGMIRIRGIVKLIISS